MSAWYLVVGATGKGPKLKTVSMKSTGMDPGFIFHEKLYHSSGVRYYPLFSNLRTRLMYV